MSDMSAEDIGYWLRHGDPVMPKKRSHGAEMPITFKGIDLIVHYGYTAEEPAEHYGDAPYPGCPEQLDVLEVHHKGEEITELLDWQMVEDIAEKVREAME